MTQLGMVISLDRCMDTRSCMLACKQENDVALGSFWVQTYTSTTGDYPDTETYFIPVLCQQCRNAPCIPACPEGVFTKREDGIVAVDASKCTGCDAKACMAACPYDAIWYNEKRNIVGKCDLCAHMVDAGRQPACSAACCSAAWLFGDFDDPESDVSQAIAAMGDAAHQLKPELGADPAVYYILHGKEWHGMDGVRVR